MTTPLKLDTTDNNCGRLIVPEEALGLLRPFSGVELRALAKDNRALLVFPPGDVSADDRSDESCLFSLCEQSRTLTTANLMGYVGIGPYELSIRSRFSSDATGDFLLYYLVQKVFCPTVIDLPHRSARDFGPDILAFLFPKMLRTALTQGVYKEYRTREYNDSRVSGRIDIARQLRLDMPFTGNVAYSKREFSFDNDVTQLVRHTIEHIRRGPLGSALLSSGPQLREAVECIVDATPSFDAGAIHHVLARNIATPLNHPYFSAYAPLQRLCILILRGLRLRAGENPEKIFGIVFDGAWLWEEYLAGLLRQCGFIHPRNKSREKSVSLFLDGGYPRYPDFYRDGMVIDAKYKRLDNHSIARDDLHQLISYMHILQAQQGILLHPHKGSTQLTHVGSLRGHGGEVALLSMCIPANASDYPAFVQKMAQEERALLSFISAAASHTSP